MRTKRVYSSQEYHSGYGNGDTERYEYLCPCGKRRVIEEHDAWLQYSKCAKKY